MINGELLTKKRSNDFEKSLLLFFVTQTLGEKLTVHSSPLTVKK